MTRALQLVAWRAEQLPVRNTFIHFDDSGVADKGSKPAPASSRRRSAPPHMLHQPFLTIWPEHEEKHIRRECKPCAYYFRKADSCRLGGHCGFCHLCPKGAMKARKKEKILALREQERLVQQCASMMSSDVSTTPSSGSGSTTPSSWMDSGSPMSIHSNNQTPVHSKVGIDLETQGDTLTK